MKEWEWETFGGVLVVVRATDRFTVFGMCFRRKLPSSLKFQRRLSKQPIGCSRDILVRLERRERDIRRIQTDLVGENGLTCLSLDKIWKHKALTITITPLRFACVL